MMRDAIAQEQTCPSRGDLAAFNYGRLSLDQLDSIAEHLSRCARCESSLQGLQKEDVMLSLLQRRPLELSVDDSVCEQLANRALAIPSKDTDLATVAHPAPAEEEITSPLPVAFGTYLLLEQLGQGGMGVVYKARQESLKRLVALKMVRTGIHATTDERLRFQREGEAVARIRHPHVVQIYEFGQQEGQLFFSMELLEGGTLADRITDRPLPPRQAAELVRSLAQAVQAAHQQGVVHRDLKPGNVLFSADGTARITDFGLAKMLNSEDSQTQTDAIVGTPSYMAPEQARGESRLIGPATDVHALGAILYETLTGQPPFRAESRYQTMELVRTREPKPLSQLRPGISRDLEAICLKCLEKETVHRYQSALEVADELDRWLRGEPTRVRPPNRLARGRRLVRKYPRGAALVILAILLPLVGLAAWYWFDPDRPAHAIERRLARGERVILIGETSVPHWSRWGLRQGVTNTRRLRDGVFSISGLDSTVLTLLPDPQRSYRLSAEVRHEHTTPMGAVGLAFLHSQHNTVRGTEHCLGALTFNDLEATIQDPGTGPMVSHIDFKLLSASESAPDKSAQLFARHFVPALAKPGEGPWRSLAVEVRPEGVDLFWQGGHLVHLPHDRMLQAFANAKKELINGQMVDPLPDLQPAFAPRDALGLFVLRSQASFRRVEVTPLPSS